VVRTVREYERAGAAAIHIEDQLTPKRPAYQGFDAGFVTRKEMVDKIRAALDARTDDQLAIVARCDVSDENERTERLIACLEAGADIAWFSGRDAGALQKLHAALPPNTKCMGVLQRNMT